MTREKTLLVVKELGEVLTRHRVLCVDDPPAGLTMVDWVGEGAPPNPFRSVQYLDGETWTSLGD
jgi:hypothetical protein